MQRSSPIFSSRAMSATCRPTNTDCKPNLRYDYPLNTPNTACRPIKDAGKRRIDQSGMTHDYVHNWRESCKISSQSNFSKSLLRPITSGSSATHDLRRLGIKETGSAVAAARHAALVVLDSLADDFPVPPPHNATRPHVTWALGVVVFVCRCAALEPRCAGVVDSYTSGWRLVKAHLAHPATGASPGTRA